MIKGAAPYQQAAAPGRRCGDLSGPREGPDGTTLSEHQSERDKEKRLEQR